jgi:hypothetical protein
MIQTSFIVTPTAGDVYATEFIFVNTTTSSESIRHIAWDFGDNSDFVYDAQQITHIYQYPGTYTARLTSVNWSGEGDIYQRNITVDYPYRDYVLFTQIPEQYANPGKRTSTPFKVQVLTSQINIPIILNLFCVNSKSIPYEYVPERWSFLNPTWKFTDVNGTFITSLSVEGKPVYKNNYIVGLSGEAEFYFIDSTSTGIPGEDCPVILTCTLETSGAHHPLESNIYSYPTYANNKNVRGALIWYVNNVQPNLLKVTSNYLTQLYSQYWESIKVPFLVTPHYDRVYELSGTQSDISDIIFSYPQTNQIGLLSPVSATVSNLLSSEYIFDEAPLYFLTTDENNYRTGGYIFTTFTPLQTANSSSVQASATIYPYSTFQGQLGNTVPNPFVFISNPEVNTINKITFTPIIKNCPELTYYQNQNILTTGNIKQIPVPALSSNTTFNYNMSGFSGIYSMAIDPRDFSLLACDAELERVYKFSSTGTLLSTIELSSFDGPIQKSFFVWSFNITTPLLSTNSYYLDNTVYLVKNKNNYIVSVGGAIQPLDSFDIDIENRTLQFLTSNSTPNSSVRVDVVQLFNPLLPRSYVSTLTNWITATPNTTNSFYLTGAPELSADSKYYIVSIEGVLQSPNSYTVDLTSKAITFSSPVTSSSTIQATFLPRLNTPASWTYTLMSPTTALPLTGDTNYIANSGTDFFINIGGVFQPTISYKHDFINHQLIFNDILPASIPIIITQTSIPDIVDAPSNFTPSSITLDKNYNFWVTFFNNLSVVKFDPNFNVSFITNPNSPSPIYYSFDSDFLLKPAIAETDKDSNCWVTYAHPLCSSLVKYGSDGSVITQIPLDDYSVPVALAVNLDNNIWVANIANVLSAAGNIQLYDNNTYTLIKSITGIPRPSYLAVDNFNNLWFTHSINGLGYYNTNTDTLCAWSFNNNTFIPLLLDTPLSGASLITALTSQPNIFVNDEEIGGLGVDSFNRIWFINSYTNTTNVITTASPDFTTDDIYTFTIRPSGVLGYFVDLNTGATLTNTLPTYNYRSAQASGDWTGLKWYQKYIPLNQNTKIIKGESTNFNIEKFTNKYQVRRVNESFNTSEYYKSLALPEILKNNSFLWDNFFAAAVGTAELSSNEDLGQITYEKIANFLTNHADVDTCNIDQLISLANKTNVFAANYATELPAEIKRMLDISSISKNKLFGLLNNQPILKQSLGTELNPYTTILSAGTQIILKSKLDNSLTLLTVPIQDNTIIYPLSAFYGFGFAAPVITNYQFYTYQPQYSGKYIENVIDWNSTFTTLNSTISTFEEWYGENGVLETTFNYLLTKNLFLK